MSRTESQTSNLTCSLYFLGQTFRYPIVLTRNSSHLSCFIYLVAYIQSVTSVPNRGACLAAIYDD